MLGWLWKWFIYFSTDGYDLLQILILFKIWRVTSRETKEQLAYRKSHLKIRSPLLTYTLSLFREEERSEESHQRRLHLHQIFSWYKLHSPFSDFDFSSYSHLLRSNRISTIPSRFELSRRFSDRIWNPKEKPLYVRIESDLSRFCLLVYCRDLI